MPDRVSKLYRPDDLLAAIEAFALYMPVERDVTGKPSFGIAKERAQEIIKRLHKDGWKLVKCHS